MEAPDAFARTQWNNTASLLHDGPIVLAWSECQKEEIIDICAFKSLGRDESF